MIQATEGKLHWNYFLALENDLGVVSRYIEFCEPNYDVYSIELAHLLFAAASEVDVVAKLLCLRLSPGSNPDNINQYRPILMAGIPDLTSTNVLMSRYGLTLKPWDNWAIIQNPMINPDWWRGYNNVKHQRDIHFNMATLKNALNALSALLILTIHYYSYALSSDPVTPLKLKDTTRELEPESSLLRLRPNCYYSHLIVSTS